MAHYHSMDAPRTQPPPPDREPEPSFGPDEEGELPIAPEKVPDDNASWVNHGERDKPA